MFCYTVIPIVYEPRLLIFSQKLTLHLTNKRSVLKQRNIILGFRYAGTRHDCLGLTFNFQVSTHR